MTVAESEVAECVAREMTQREIAEYLGVAMQTVRTHLHFLSEALPRRGQLRGYYRVWVWVHRAE